MDPFLQQFNKAARLLIDQDKIGIEQLCNQMDMSRSQIHRKVKTLTGSSTSLLIRNIKLEKARELLGRTDLSITEVAHRCRIKSLQNMSKYFSREYGMSPTQYRLEQHSK